MRKRKLVKTHSLTTLILVAGLTGPGCYSFAARQHEIEDNERKVKETTDEIQREIEKSKTLQPPKEEK